jgi:pyruvate kinase
MLRAGMNVVRLNMSHGTRAQHAVTVKNVREAAARVECHVPILMDLTGPKMRIGTFADGQVELAKGAEFTLTSRDIIGDGSAVSINYPPLVDDIDPGDRILMGDGEIELRVLSKTGSEVLCEVVIGGELRSNKGINAPGVKLRQEVPTDKDVDDVRFGLDQNADYFALSFVRYAREIDNLREIIDKSGADTPIITKLEKIEALDNLNPILASTDAVMIARGDLGLEVPLEEVPLIQKDIILRANAWGRPVITATQMLESMIENPRPTRAEAADVANAVFDGTDAVMLSGETAMGKYPVEAIKTMARIAEAAESRIDYAKRFSAIELHHRENIAEAIARAACQTAIEMNAKLIVCCTRSGQSARLVAKYRPPMKIAAVSPNDETLRRSKLYWNTIPVAAKETKDTNEMVAGAKEAVLWAGVAQRGDRIVIVAGVPVDVPGTTNTIKGDIL